MSVKNINIIFSLGGRVVQCPVQPITWYLPVLSAKKEKQASITGNASILKKFKQNFKRFTVFSLKERKKERTFIYLLTSDTASTFIFKHDYVAHWLDIATGTVLRIVRLDGALEHPAK